MPATSLMASTSTLASASDVGRPYFNQQQKFDAATMLPNSANCPAPADPPPPPPPTPATPLVKRSYSNVVQHNSTTSLQFDPNRAAKKHSAKTNVEPWVRSPKLLQLPNV
ncbi:hypothetical protein Salat_2653300 [Sesamum alatum]|uniref:Uncharacterized protein n=1 Tax=Sesamum alatum TaxID=300844 RepID=A0AAE2CAV3_9LAMI|nr:hypothetical protein Salat_2653300 [Sesamum alatum]